MIRLLATLAIAWLIAAPYQTVHAESAKVTGGVTCGTNDVGTKIGGFGIDIDGEIDSTTVERVKKIFDELRDYERKEQAGTAQCPIYGTSYSINSPGGSVTAAMAIGRMFRSERAHLETKDNGVCISACVLILAGAVNRQMRGNEVGIHRPYLETTSQRSVTTAQVKNAYSTMLQDMRAYLREMNVSEALATDMLATEPESVRMLTDSELKRYSLVGLDPEERQTRAIAQEASDVQAANQLGLDRREYIRRKALTNQACGTWVADTDRLRQRESCIKRIMTTGR